MYIWLDMETWQEGWQLYQCHTPLPFLRINLTGHEKPKTCAWNAVVGLGIVSLSPQLTKFLLIFSKQFWLIKTCTRYGLVGFEILSLSPSPISLSPNKFPRILRGMTDQNMCLQYSWLSYGDNTHSSIKSWWKTIGWDEYQSPPAAAVLQVFALLLTSLW